MTNEDGSPTDEFLRLVQDLQKQVDELKARIAVLERRA